LDTYQHPAPIGVPGEIYIDAAVEPLPAETQERTDGVSVAQQNGEARLLRTGQRARYSPDGGIELLGETSPSIAPERDNKEEAEEARSMTPTEQVLAEIWSEVIGVKEVGLHDNFFDLGGHSVLVTQIIARIRSRFQVQLDLRTVFESPTIGLLAAAVEEALVAEIEDLPEVEAERLSGGTELATEEAR
jgi:acyl carrier protein